MPYKIGDGFKLQAYDPDNGQYTEDEKNKMRNFDNFWLNQPLTLGYEPHIPSFGIHDWEYAFNFVQKFKSHLKETTGVSIDKIHFLLDGEKKPERTAWLKERGFFCLTQQM